jgi:hypothetical protein
MKKSATSKQTLDPAAGIPAAGPEDSPAETYQDLADLVWKYFGEEITQSVQETQQALTPTNGRSTTAKSQKR